MENITAFIDNKEINILESEDIVKFEDYDNAKAMAELIGLRYYRVEQCKTGEYRIIECTMCMDSDEEHIRQGDIIYHYIFGKMIVDNIDEQKGIIELRKGIMHRTESILINSKLYRYRLSRFKLKEIIKFIIHDINYFDECRCRVPSIIGIGILLMILSTILMACADFISSLMSERLNSMGLLVYNM